MTYGGSSRIDGVGRAVHEQPLLKRRLDNRRRRTIELEPPHHAGAAHVADVRVARRQRAEPRFEVRADPRDVRHQPASTSSSRKTSAARQASRLPPYVLP